MYVPEGHTFEEMEALTASFRARYPRNRRRGQMRADGRGALNARREAEEAHERRMEESKAKREREEKRKKIAAPVLRSLAEIEAVVEEGPKSPFYVIRNRGFDIKQIGKAVFGGDGYNRVKTESTDHNSNIGPHFDAYAGHFSPWTIHRNRRLKGTVRATFLPDDIWQSYIERTQGLRRLGAAQQEKRFAIGKRLFDEGVPLTTAALGNSTLTLLWHGDISRPDLPGPSVHEYIRQQFFNIGEDTSGSYSLYARQLVKGAFEGFTEV